MIDQQFDIEDLQQLEAEQGEEAQPVGRVACLKIVIERTFF